MPRTVLLTLGRLPKGLDAARSFARAGWRVIVAEPFAWHLARVSRAVARSYRVAEPNADGERYLADLAGIVAGEGVELVVPVSEEAMHAAAVADRLPPGARFYGMAQRDLLAVHDKLGFTRIAAGHGLAVPATWRADAPEAAALAAKRDYVAKPLFSCSGIGVRLLPRGTPLPDDLPRDRYLVQDWVRGLVCSTFSLAHAGRVQVTAVYRGTVMGGTVAVAFERIAAPAVEAWVAGFVRATGWSGSISFDFVLDEAGCPFAIECNPRMTSGVHFVDPDDLAPAIADPASMPRVRLREVRQAQQFFPCLTETQGSLFRRGAPFRRNLGHLLRSRDVTWSARDPLPLLTMPMTSWRILRQTLFEGRSMGEAATADIGWFGPA